MKRCQRFHGRGRGMSIVELDALLELLYGSKCMRGAALKLLEGRS
jgi:hypothetical protein